MGILNTISLESNKQIKINFDGGDLSSYAGLILIKEFSCKMSFIKLLKAMFKTYDTAMFRYHTDDENLTDATKNDVVSYAVQYGEFMYQASSWKYPKRVVCKVEKPVNQFIHMYTFYCYKHEFKSKPAHQILL